MIDPEPIPGTLCVRWEYTLDGTLISNMHTHVHARSDLGETYHSQSSNLHFLVGDRRTLENPERNPDILVETLLRQ